jgi:hypothetical protein
MNRIQGNPQSAPIECINPVRSKWRVRWDFQSDDNGNGSFMEQEFDHKPSLDEIKAVVIEWCNNNTDNNILSGFSFDGHPVWLSETNQLNYKREYDLAVQTNGANLPVTFKFGDNQEPFYYSFNSLESLSDFYTQASSHIRNAISAGWKLKDEFDWDKYQL